MFNRAALPRDITSYDLLKTFAVVFMLIDHIGFYFFPDDMWWRTFGRLCVPVWFFLIGYARSRDIGPRLWIGGIILLVVGLICGKYLIPLNILFTFIVLRLILDPMMRRVTRAGANALWAVAAIWFFAYLPTAMVLEYGSAGALLAMVGWFMRNNTAKDRGALSEANVQHYVIFAVISFVLLQSISFGLSQPQFLTLATLGMVVFGALYFFKPVNFPKLTVGLGPVAGLVRFTGRWTLEIYVGHLVVLDIISTQVDSDRFSLFSPHWTATGFAHAATMVADMAGVGP